MYPFAASSQTKRLSQTAYKTIENLTLTNNQAVGATGAVQISDGNNGFAADNLFTFTNVPSVVSGDTMTITIGSKIVTLATRQVGSPGFYALRPGPLTLETTPPGYSAMTIASIDSDTKLTLVNNASFNGTVSFKTTGYNVLQVDADIMPSKSNYFNLGTSTTAWNSSGATNTIVNYSASNVTPVNGVVNNVAYSAVLTAGVWATAATLPTRTNRDPTTATLTFYLSDASGNYFAYKNSSSQITISAPDTPLVVDFNGLIVLTQTTTVYLTAAGVDGTGSLTLTLGTVTVPLNVKFVRVA